MFHKIFTAIDFSPSSNEALRQAHERALATGAQLAVCHVVPNELRSNMLFPHISRISAMQFPLEMNQVIELATVRITEVTGRTDKDYTLIVDDGTPQALILEHAEEWGADLVVVGSHGETAAADALLGSVTSSILRHAHCPVLVVRPGRNPGEKAKSIVVGTDFSESAEAAVQAAAAEAKRTGATLKVVHCLDQVWSAASYPAMAFGGAPFNVSPEMMTDLQVIAEQHLEHSVEHLKTEVQTLVVTGSAGPALIQAASEPHADLIVVGTVGRSGLRRALLGSVAETVARDAQCSVLIVRKQ